MERKRRYPTLAETRERIVRERRTTAIACVKAALQAIAERDVEACVVGSLARGDFDTDSDVDFLVLSPISGGSRLQLAAEIDRHFAGTDIPVDVVFQSDLEPAEQERISRDRLELGDLG